MEPIHRKIRLLAVLLLTVAFDPLEAIATETTTASNQSTATLCLEEDNVNIPLSGKISEFIIVATQPTYAVGIDNCVADFTDCPPQGGTDFDFTPLTQKVYDNGTTAFWMIRKDKFWRPVGMTVKVNGVTQGTDIHRIEVVRKIVGANSWPIFCVLYSDGNLRLIPHPPVGAASVCFGTSVIVGPAAIASRPIAEIASVDFDTKNETVKVVYRGGGSAVLHVGDVNRTRARVKVEVNYPTTLPFCTVRSNFVADGKSDCDHVDWTSPAGVLTSNPVLTFPGDTGKSWFFTRKTRSTQRTSAPDIRITANDSEKPKIRYQSPKIGSKLRGRRDHRGTATDDCGVRKVEYKWSGSRWKMAKLNGKRWQFPVRASHRDFRGKTRVRIMVKATDINGNRAIKSRTFSP